MIRLIPVAAVLISAPLSAEETAMPLRAAPEYFIETVFAVSVSGALARACPDLSVNPLAVTQASDGLDAKLESDGFPVADPVAAMSDAQSKMDLRRDAFMTAYPLIGAGTDEVCAAGRVEMAAGTVLGSLLVEVPE